MDHQDYIQENNKVYDILFQNIKAFDIEEIKGFFERFGSIDVKTAGDETGYRFVKFKSFDDAKRAFEAYKGNVNFKFLKPRKKKQEPSIHVTKNEASCNDARTNKVDDIPWDSGTKYNGPVWNDQSYASSNSSNKEGENTSGQKNKRNFNNKGRQNFRHDFGNKSLQKSLDDKDGFENNFCNSLTDRESQSSAKFESKSPNQTFNSKGKHNSNNWDNDCLKKKLSPNKNSNFDNQKRTFNVKKSKDNATNSVPDETNDEEIPDLVSVKSKESKRPIVDAQQVVVGNIPSNYGAAYILHLFDSFEPLAVSNVITEPKTNIRYCFVYFKSAEDSTGVESRFDRFNVEGKKLVVLRPTKLMEEAA